ncbi:PD40 domain-containing protein [Cerasicoccus arenae]|uniref:Protein TolB n=1 Tax=Cerasicoccus arenae TaxID=424488 RepID=A0A8J3DJM3_9BACT|nr:PD40 domain-containing protein [Cerasicoccus arenae]MBK1858774.1 PD40 domain-containing protein [Cerasicoccus arenae]GHC07386.1 hypothetical protein GCM10007047_25680 [Cerasicoccus arenae]
MRLFRLLCPLIGLLFAFQFNAYGQSPYTIEKKIDKKVTPIAIQSGDASAQALASFAFNTHGAFSVTTPSKASAVLVLTPLTGNRCQLKIVTGSPAQVLYEGTADGSSPESAILRACDAAVKALTNKPGYFGGQIAFVSNRTGNREVWMGDLFFRWVKPLTTDKSNALRPYLAPDAKTVFYRSYYRTGFPDVFKQDVATGRRVPFASYKGTNAGGAVSPNGQQVALTLSAPGNMELYVADINSSGKPLRLTTNRYVETDPAWSPDGRRLVVTSDQLGYPQLYEIPSRGGPMTRLQTNISKYCAEPSWNPLDESKIVFTANMGGSYELALYQFGQGSAQVLTSFPGDAKEAVWLNDGRHIIYTEKAPGNREKLVIFDSETKKRTPITPDNFGNASQASFAY